MHPAAVLHITVKIKGKLKLLKKLPLMKKEEILV
jgi:hypothetical protein